jgi:hypothetical protein
MTASQCTAHPFEATIDLQADIAWDRLHPISEQSVPIPATFGLSHQLRVTWQLFGVMTASVVVPSDSPAVASFGDADGASGFPGTETSLVSLLGSGVESSVHAYTLMSDAIARQLTKPSFLIVTSCVSGPDHPGWVSRAELWSTLM